jgi:hypothetical protein
MKRCRFTMLFLTIIFSILDYGLSGSASVDPLAARTITVVDQLNKNRGLDQLATLRCGQYGTDAAYGAINLRNTRVDGGLGYSVTPSWHKTNRNRLRRMDNLAPDATPGDYPAANNYTASVFDNLFVQHAIPRSEQQYAWITGSMIAGKAIFGLNKPSCFSASTLSQLETGSQRPYFGRNYFNNYAGSNNFLITQLLNTDTHVMSSTPALGWSTGKFYEPSSNKMVIGTSATQPWNSVIGGSGASAKPYTVTAWIYIDESADGGTSNMIIAFGGYSRRIWWTQNKIQADILGTSNTGYVATPANAVMPGRWYHIAFVYTGGDPGGSNTQNYMKMYIDGVAQTVYVAGELNNPASINESLSTNKSNIAMAKDSNYPFWGLITELGVFARALTDAEILEIYNLKKPSGGLYSINDTGISNLIAYYRFNPSLGDTTSAIVNRAASPTANTDGAGTIQGFVNSNVGWDVLGNGMGADKLNILNNNRNGTYGYPTWKQIRVGETNAARHLRKLNKIGTVVAPTMITGVAGVGKIQPLQPNTFVDFIETPVASADSPVIFSFEDNTENADAANNIVLTVPYANRYNYFANQALNNRLGITIDLDEPIAYDSVVDFTVSSSLSVKIDYTQRVFPSEVNAYQNKVRGRTAFTISNIWNKDRTLRSPFSRHGGGAYGPPGSQGQVIASASIWPLDGPLQGTGSSNPRQGLFLTASITASDGAGELMNFYSRYSHALTGSSAAGKSFTGNMFGNTRGEIQAAPTYAARVPAGMSLPLASPTSQGYSTMAAVGAPQWAAPEQAGKDPYEKYTTYADQLRAAAKDYSIIPEYRVSPLMDTYLNQEGGNFLSTAVEFDLTGAAYPNSSVEGFYRTYSNSDFLKYFKYVDEDLNDQRSGDLKIRKDKISLNCEAFVKFLPYKGFYPAERTLELATILSRSFGPQLTYNPNATVGYTYYNYTKQHAAYRIFLEPLMSPGILYNSIKSGIACSNFVLADANANNVWVTALANTLPTASQASPETSYPETAGTGRGLYYGLTPSLDCNAATAALVTSSCARILSIGSSSSGSHAVGQNDSNSFRLRKMPFEAIYRPTEYFNARFIAGDNRTDSTGFVSIYDTAPSGTSAWIPSTLRISSVSYPLQASILMGMPTLYRTNGIVNASPELGGGQEYTLAIDNFLCESMNMFVEGSANLVSRRQEQFEDQVEGQVYTGEIKLFRTLSGSVGTTEPFEMYSRASAFGTPLAATARRATQPKLASFSTTGITFSHVLPPYYSGEAKVVLTYTASYSGRPDLDDVFAQLTASYQRDEAVPNANAASAVARGTNEDIRMQINDSINLFTKIQEVPEDTNDLKSRWLIQPKFETPIMNFANVATGTVPAATYTRTTATASARQITTRGMWHQYGSVLSSSNAGVFMACGDSPKPDTNVSLGITDDERRKSLWDLVGMPKGKNQRIGDPKNEFLLEEAVVAVPFRTNDSGEREFIKFPTSARARETVDYKKTNTYRRLNLLLDKYVFPPIFDFKRFDTVDPIMMYAFEFSAKLNQKDITDIWQNLPPSVADRFEVQNAVVEEKELIDAIVSKDKRYSVDGVQGQEARQERF